MTPCLGALIWAAIAAGAGTVEPDRVGQIGGAELAVALAVLAMAGGAVLGEHLPGRRLGSFASPGRPESDATKFADLGDLRPAPASRQTPAFRTRAFRHRPRSGCRARCVW